MNKLQHIESALTKIRACRDGWITRLDLDLTPEEFDVIEHALEVAAGICAEAKRFEFFKEEKT